VREFAEVVAADLAEVLADVLAEVFLTVAGRGAAAVFFGRGMTGSGSEVCEIEEES